MPRHTVAKRRAVLYLRISLDRTGDGMAVDRQRALAAELAVARGWTLEDEYVDNSISASKVNVTRPAYQRLMADYQAGRVGAIFCYDLDRFTRQPRELEDWIDAAEQRGLAIITLNGEADLTTDAGRLFARIKIAVAKSEVERKSQRQKDANAQRRARGVVPSGVRLTGYAQDGSVIESEAELVRRIFQLFVAGQSLYAIAGQLTADGIPTRRGAKRWHPSTVRDVLTNPRYAGRQVLNGTATGHLGSWQSIVSESTFDTAAGILNDPRRVTNREGTERKHIGAGLYMCECGEPMRTASAVAYAGGGMSHRYGCASRHYMRTGAPVDTYVTEAVAAWLELHDVTPEPDAQPDAQSGELARIRERLAQVEADYDADLIDGQRYAVKRAKVIAELQAAERAQSRSRAGIAIASLDPTLSPGDAFLAAPMGVQRQIIAEHFTVTLLPVGRGRKGFDTESVRVERQKRAAA